MKATLVEGKKEGREKGRMLGWRDADYLRLLCSLQHRDERYKGSMGETHWEQAWGPICPGPLQELEVNAAQLL